MFSISTFFDLGMAATSALDAAVIVLYCIFMSYTPFRQLQKTSFHSMENFVNQSIFDVMLLMFVKGLAVYILYVRRRYSERFVLIGMEGFMVGVCILKLVLLGNHGNSGSSVAIAICCVAVTSCGIQLFVFEWLKGRLRNRMSKVYSYLLEMPSCFWS